MKKSLFLLLIFFIICPFFNVDAEETYITTTQIANTINSNHGTEALSIFGDDIKIEANPEGTELYLKDGTEIIQEYTIYDHALQVVIPTDDQELFFYSSLVVLEGILKSTGSTKNINVFEIVNNPPDDIKIFVAPNNIQGGLWLSSIFNVPLSKEYLLNVIDQYSTSIAVPKFTFTNVKTDSFEFTAIMPEGSSDRSICEVYISLDGVDFESFGSQYVSCGPTHPEKVTINGGVTPNTTYYFKGGVVGTDIYSDVYQVKTLSTTPDNPNPDNPNPDNPTPGENKPDNGKENPETGAVVRIGIIGTLLVLGVVGMIITRNKQIFKGM